MSRPEEMPAPGDQVLEEARAKLAAALQAFNAAQSALADVQSALAAGRTLPRGDLVELERVRSALAEAAEALGLDPERATLAELEERLASQERAVGLRRSLQYLGQATGPAVVAAQLAPLAADAARLATAESWSPEDEARAVVLVRLVELADAATGNGDEEHILALDVELRHSLGPAAAAVVLAAARGRLALPAHGQPVVAGGPAGEAPAPSAAAPSAAAAPSPVPPAPATPVPAAPVPPRPVSPAPGPAQPAQAAPKERTPVAGPAASAASAAAVAAAAAAAARPATPARGPAEAPARPPEAPPPADETSARLPRMAVVALVVLILIGLVTAVALIVNDRGSKTTTGSTASQSAASQVPSPSAAAAAQPSSPAGQTSPTPGSPTPQATTGSAPAPAVDVAAIAPAVDPVVVSLTITRADGTIGATGVVLNSSGAVVTNDHVIEHALTITGRVGSTGATYSGTVVGDYDTADIALIQLQGASGLVAPRIGDAASLSVGDPVVAFGQAPAQGAPPAAITATVTALNQTIPAIDPDAPSKTLPGVIQTSAPLPPQDSGGPLVNARGEVVGVNLAPLPSQPQNGTAGYALPINTALAGVQAIQQGRGG